MPAAVISAHDQVLRIGAQCGYACCQPVKISLGPLQHFGFFYRSNVELSRGLKVITFGVKRPGVFGREM